MNDKQWPSSQAAKLAQRLQFALTRLQEMGPGATRAERSHAERSVRQLRQQLLKTVSRSNPAMARQMVVDDLVATLKEVAAAKARPQSKPRKPNRCTLR